MLKVLKLLDNILVSDATIRHKVTTYGDEPSIVFRSAPKDMLMPYVVTSSPPSVMDSTYVTEKMLYNIDIYANSADYEAVVTIAERVVELFDLSRLPVDIGLNMWKDFEGFIDEEDLSVVHYTIQFTVRHISSHV